MHTFNIDARSRLGWAIADLGHALARLGRRLDPSIGTVDDTDDWFDLGYAQGHQEGARQALELVTFGKAGRRPTPSSRPIGEAYELGHARGLREAAGTAVAKP